MSRNQLAQRMGYSNLSKGASKLALWERRADLPRGDQGPRLLSVLPQLSDSLACALTAREVHERATQEAHKEASAWELRARTEEARLVVEHLDALSTLLSTPEGAVFRHTPLPSSALNLAYIGGRVLTLGELIDAWREGALKAPCPCHNQDMPVMRIAGSPLSGTHTLDAFCTIDREIVKTQHTAETLLSFAQPLMASERPRGIDGPCLDQALIAAGCTPPPIECVDPEGALIATWHPSTGELRAADGALAERLEGPDAPGVWRDLRGPARQGGNPVIGALSPLSFGAWRGSRLVVTPRAHHPYYATSGHLRDADEVIEVRWTRMPPRNVVQRVAQRCAATD